MSSPRRPVQRPSPAVLRRRRAIALGGVAAVLTAAAVLASSGGSGSGSGDDKAGPHAATAATTHPAAAKLPQLPGGGRRIFPVRRVVAFYGNPQDPALGELGVGRPAAMLRKLARVAHPYSRATRPVLPALELIATVAADAPGDDGAYVVRAPDAVIDRYLRLARRAHALLLLDVQPGRSDFPREVARLEPWLAEPDVGLALDPEWRVGPDGIPGQVIGGVGASEVNAVSGWLAGIVRRGRLPEKLFVVHQFTDSMVRDTARLVQRPGLATVFNIDGVGDRANKVSKYGALAAGTPGFHHGFKLFFHEDTGLMRPRSVMALRPRPEFVVYE